MATWKRRDDGDGSAYQRKDGRWVAEVTIGWERTPEGKTRRVRRYAYGKTAAEARTERRKLIAAREAGQLPTGDAVIVQAWMRYWLDEVCAHRVKPRTLESYRTINDNWIVPTIGAVRLTRLTPEHVEKMLAAMRVGREYTRTRADGSTSTRAAKPLGQSQLLQAYRVLSRAIKVAHQRGRVTRNVVALVDAPSIAGRRAEQYLTKEQARAALAHVQTDWNGARWSVGLSLGLRQGEVLGLLWQSEGVDGVDLEAGVLHVRRQLQRRRATTDRLTGLKTPGRIELVEYTKTKAGWRDIALPPSLVQALRAHRQEQRENRVALGPGWAQSQFGDLVFTQRSGSPVEPRADWGEWKELLEAIGATHIRQHASRHTAATLLLLQGVDVKVVADVLGHANATITRDLYQHVVPELQRDAADRMDAALWG